jgi:hypothetical protein
MSGHDANVCTRCTNIDVRGYAQTLVSSGAADYAIWRAASGVGRGIALCCGLALTPLLPTAGAGNSENANAFVMHAPECEGHGTDVTAPFVAPWLR